MGFVLACGGKWWENTGMYQCMTGELVQSVRRSMNSPGMVLIPAHTEWTVFFSAKCDLSCYLYHWLPSIETL